MSVAPTQTVMEPLETGGGYRAEALVSLVRLKWFIHLRWVMLIVLWTFLIVEQLGSERVWRPTGLRITLFALVALNLFWWVLSKSLLQRFERQGDEDVGAIRIAGLFANVQIAADLFFLTAIIRYTGGVESPLAMFYLFHMAIASLLLPRRQAFLQGVWAFLLYTLLSIGELFGAVRPHYEVLPTMPILSLHATGEYVGMMVVVVGCGIFGTLYFSLRIASRLDERERVLRSVNRALRASQDAIQELQRRKAQFMRTAAHQLKSPLAVIQTQINLLRDNPVPDATRRQIYDKIITRCQVAIGQVHDLLTFARVQEADTARHARSSTDVAQVVRDLCDRNRPVIDAKQLEFSCEIPQNGEWHVPVDPTDLTDAIANLIENAVKYTEPPGRVSVAVTKRDDRVLVSVRDSGMGMAVDTQPELFDAYRRGNRALEKCIFGSGLGLSIVRAVMEQVSGKIIVKSRPDEGSAFTLVFPTRAPSPEVPDLGGTMTNVVSIE